MNGARLTVTLWVVLASVLAGCSTREQPEPDPTPEATQTEPSPVTPPAPEETTVPDEADPVLEEVSEEQWQKMIEADMVRDECPITRRDQLRRVVINHWDFDGDVQRGELVVNADVAESAARIFTEIWEAEFPIRQMQSLENYDGDSNASLQDDNTAAFNCRRSDQINAPFDESPHANGRSVDINPLENPWMDLRCQCWSPSAEFNERSEGPGKILEGGPVWQAFIDEDWIWQNIDVPDYMHFDTGYPSEPFS